MPYADKSKRREYQARWAREARKKNPEPNRAYQRSLRKYKAEWARKYRAANKEAYRTQKREQYRINHERELNRARAYRLKHPDKHRAAVRAWKLAHPEEASLMRRETKHRRRAAEGKFSRADIRRLFVEQDFLCAICRCLIETNYHLDHIIPVSKGGTNWPTNLQLLCPPCNRRKGAN